MFNIGIIGCGKIAQVRHIPEYAGHPQARLSGFYDLNQERARELAEKWGGKAYSSWEEMLADPGIDAVSVCVANNAHAQLSIAALRAGKHVLCEKPMATTLADCEAMVAADRAEPAPDEGPPESPGTGGERDLGEDPHLPHHLRPRRAGDLERGPGEEHLVL